MPADELMSFRFGGATVAENLDRAIAAGRLIQGEDGSLALPEAKAKPGWSTVANAPLPPCNFLLNVVFDGAYARGAVPYACRSCYKVKAAPKTLRELVAAWVIGRHLPVASKWGLDIDNSFSQAIWAGIFYTPGLEEARRLYWVLREAFDADPKLGPGVPIGIKRGCSAYEYALGPSDQYQFTADQAGLETLLMARFQSGRGQRRKQSQGQAQRQAFPLMQLPYWIDFAFRTGDDTYLDFTGGQRLKPKMVSYDPGAPPGRVE